MEVRVGFDGANLQGTQRDLLRSRGRAACDHYPARDAIAILHRPLDDALAAHRTADDRVPPCDAEMVGERGLDINLIADRRDGDPRAVRLTGGRIYRRRPGRALTAAEHVRTHDEEPVGVDRAAGPYQRVPPTEL